MSIKRTHSCVHVVASCGFLTLISVVLASGDFNADGQFDCTDIDLLVAEVAAGTHSPTFDLNGDGNTDRADVTAWLTEAGSANLSARESYIYSDANLDGVTDVSDWDGAWQANKFSYDVGWCGGDWNADGRADVSDSLIWHANAFLSYPSVDGAGFDGTLEPGTGQAVYDPSTGNLYFKTNTQPTIGILVDGPEPIALADLSQSIFFSPDREGGRDLTVWSKVYFADKQQWSGIYVGNVSGVNGVFHLATYETGLTADDFGTLEYGGTRDLYLAQPEAVFETHVEIARILPGDANLDGGVDVSDFNILNVHKYNAQLSGAWGTGDFDGNGVVDVSDFNIWNGNRFTLAGNPVPEPPLNLLFWLVPLCSGKKNRPREGAAGYRVINRRVEVKIDSPLTRYRGEQ